MKKKTHLAIGGKIVGATVAHNETPEAVHNGESAPQTEHKDETPPPPKQKRRRIAIGGRLV